MSNAEPSREGCPFCSLPPDRIVAVNDLAVAITDRFPVSVGHSLVIPKRHIPDWWAASPEERQAIGQLVDQVRGDLEARHHPDGYNIGINNGAAAGQTVSHLHVHLIPRYDGDTPDPRGGVRHVIPGKGHYPFHEPSSLPSSLPSARPAGRSTPEG